MYENKFKKVIKYEASIEKKKNIIIQKKKSLEETVLKKLKILCILLQKYINFHIDYNMNTSFLYNKIKNESYLGDYDNNIYKKQYISGWVIFIWR